MPAKPSQKWSAKIGGALSQPIVVGKHVFVAAVDQHRLLCLNRETGKQIWDFVAGGRIDSPPSWYRGLLVFGSRDGRIYCLEAETGKLVWRFRAAPADLWISAFGQLESAWPAYGSQIVQNGKVYCCAGRSMNLSSGVYLYALDVKTGAVLRATNLEADLKSHGEVKNAVLTDILVGDEKRLHMRGYVVNTDTLERAQEHHWEDMKKDPITVPYIKSYGGFLDSSWYTDRYLIYGKRPNVGHLLVVDTAQAVLYGHQGYKDYSDRGANMQAVAKVNQKGCRVFSRSTDLAKILTNQKSSRSYGFASREGDRWSTTVPFRGLAMVAGEEKLYMACVPDKYGKDEDPWKYLEGRGGGVLAVFSKESGKQLSELPLESAPVFDGMSAAYGSLFVSCADGTVQCYGN
jgi:hypothetical protein